MDFVGGGIWDGIGFLIFLHVCSIAGVLELKRR